MVKIGIIFGSNVLFDLTRLKKKIVKTSFGKTTFYVKKNLYILPRHGIKHGVPPHKINHKANIAALKKAKVDFIIGVSSVGSLKKNISPGSIVIPHDYINFCNVQTFFDHKIVHVSPGVDEGLQKLLLNAASKLRISVHRSVYVQTHGPRLETKAEINMLKHFADVVGMTMASEATLAKEIGLRYASICSVDNYANGLTPKELSFEDIKKIAQNNTNTLRKLLSKVFVG